MCFSQKPCSWYWLGGDLKVNLPGTMLPARAGTGTGSRLLLFCNVKASGGLTMRASLSADLIYPIPCDAEGQHQCCSRSLRLNLWEGGSKKFLLTCIGIYLFWEMLRMGGSLRALLPSPAPMRASFLWVALALLQQDLSEIFLCYFSKYLNVAVLKVLVCFLSGLVGISLLAFYDLTLGPSQCALAECFALTFSDIYSVLNSWRQDLDPPLNLLLSSLPVAWGHSNLSLGLLNLMSLNKLGCPEGWWMRWDIVAGGGKNTSTYGFEE